MKWFDGVAIINNFIVMLAVHAGSVPRGTLVVFSGPASGVLFYQLKELK